MSIESMLQLVGGLLLTSATCWLVAYLGRRASSGVESRLDRVFRNGDIASLVLVAALVTGIGTMVHGAMPLFAP